jgi:hypothetical protein
VHHQGLFASLTPPASASDPPGSGTPWSGHMQSYFRLAMVTAACQHALEFLAAVSTAQLNISNEGLTLTRAKIRDLARGPACKYLFFSLFFLLRGRCAWALVPLAVRSFVFVAWTARDVMRWVGTSGGNGSQAILETLLGLLGTLVGALVMKPNWAALSDDSQAEVLARRLFQVNVLLECIVGWELMNLPYPGKMHQLLTLWVYSRITLPDILGRVLFKRDAVEHRTPSPGDQSEDLDDDDDQEEEGDDEDDESS